MIRVAPGLALIEALVVAAVLAFGLLAVIPRMGRLRASALTAAGARQIAVTLQAQRFLSVTRAESHGLWFQRERGEWVWYGVRDGNGNGLRTSEIKSGLDPLLWGPHRLGDQVEGIRLGFPPVGPIPVIPPGKGTIGDLDDPIRIGNTDLLAFGPLGTSASGTIFVTDGQERLFAVVLFGLTGRLRVWRYDTGSGVWSR